MSVKNKATPVPERTKRIAIDLPLSVYMDLYTAVGKAKAQSSENVSLKGYLENLIRKDVTKHGDKEKS